MHAIHVLLGSVAAVGLIVSLVVSLIANALPHHQLGRHRPGDRLLAIIVFGAAVIGHAASLLPETPGWYDISVLVATILVIAWAVRSLPPRTAGPTSVRPTPSVRSGRPDHQTPRYGSSSTHIVDAEIVEDSAGDAPVTSLAERRSRSMPVATQQTFASAGPAGNATAMGSTYVAANLSGYVPERGRHARLARPAHVQRAARTARDAHAKRHPDLRRRLLGRYGDGRDARGLNVSERT